MNHILRLFKRLSGLIVFIEEKLKKEKLNRYIVTLMCRNDELSLMMSWDELSWLFTNWFKATRHMKVKRMGITEILKRIWLFSANKIKNSESGSKQPIQLIVELKSSLWHIIVTFICWIVVRKPNFLHKISSSLLDDINSWVKTSN